MALALFLCAAAAAQVPPPGVALVHIVSQPLRASALLGMEVRDAQGGPIGAIEDLILDFEKNEVRCALVSRAQGRVAVKLLDLRLSLEKDHASFERAAGEATNVPPGAPSARRLIQKTVWALNGTALGRLDDLLVDAHAGAVPFVMLRAKGKLHPLPLDALREEAGRLVTDLDPALLRDAPAFSDAELEANLENNEFLRRHAFFADRLTRARSAAQPTAPP